MALLDRCIFTPTTGGTADFIVSAAVTGYQTPAQANAVNATTYHYAAESSSKTEWEVGTGTYTSASATLARTTVIFSSNSGSKTNFTSAPIVMISALAEDFPNVTVASGKSLTVNNTLTLAASDGSTLAIGSGGTLGTAAYTASSSYLLAANNLSDVTAATARSNLGLGSIATQAASAVAITGGTIAGLTGLAIRDTSAAFDVTLAAVSSAALSAGRTLTLDMGNVAHTLAFGTTANTITFPNIASGTVAMLNANNVFTANGALSSGAGPGGTFSGTWITGGSATTTKPYVLIEPTGTLSTGWSTSGTGLGVNAASGFTGNLLDFQVAGVSQLKLSGGGNLTIPNGSIIVPAGGGGFFWDTTGHTGVALFSVNQVDFSANSSNRMLSIYNTPQIQLGSTIQFGFGSAANSGTSSTNLDTIFTRKGAANWQHGAADAAAPVAQTISVQSVVAGTTNVAGVDVTVRGSASTGNLSGGKIILQTTPAGGSGTAQNAFATALTLTAPAINMQPSVVVGNQALGLNDTDGFLYIPSCAGTPAGTPTTQTGRVPMVFDTTNNKFYIYNGAWKGGTNPGAFS